MNHHHHICICLSHAISICVCLYVWYNWTAPINYLAIYTHNMNFSTVILDHSSNSNSEAITFFMELKMPWLGAFPPWPIVCSENILLIIVLCMAWKILPQDSWSRFCEFVWRKKSTWRTVVLTPILLGRVSFTKLLINGAQNKPIVRI